MCSTQVVLQCFPILLIHCNPKLICDQSTLLVWGLCVCLRHSSGVEHLMWLQKHIWYNNAIKDQFSWIKHCFSLSPERYQTLASLMPDCIPGQRVHASANLCDPEWSKAAGAQCWAHITGISSSRDTLQLGFAVLLSWLFNCPHQKGDDLHCSIIITYHKIRGQTPAQPPHPPTLISHYILASD